LVRALRPVVVILAVLVACGERAKSPPFDSLPGANGLRPIVWKPEGDRGPLGTSDSLVAPPCAGTRADSDPIAFSVVDLGPSARGDHIPFPDGPEGRAVVGSNDEWARVWDLLTDSIPLPAVDLRNSIVLIAATQTYSSSPVDLKFESVRRCRASGEIVAALRLYAKTLSHDYPGRDLAAIELSRSEVSGRRVRFIHVLPDSIAR
jgi:hypothetical protein